ncbi:MAG: aldo/keto reductase [Chitinivibrionales bacterium]|nr:aldo/keto reductase [Chitinivibrionales bacterium]
MQTQTETAYEIQPDTRIAIHKGIKMPILGFGTFRLDAGAETEGPVLNALNSGYRLVDTAAVYRNEADVGRAIRDSGIPREDIFVTTKLWKDAHGADRARDAFNKSLDALKTDYIDLYLIHWPDGGNLVETWETMIELVQGDTCRAIGVSNFRKEHIEEITRATSVRPSVNQIKFNVYEYPQELAEYCMINNIAVEAYSPLGQGKYDPDERLKSIAVKLGRSTAQVMLRWILQKGIIAIPRSSQQQHIAENMDVFGFAIPRDDMMVLDSI